MATRQEDVQRTDLLSTVEPMGSDVPTETRTDNNLITRNPDGTVSIVPHDEADARPDISEDPEDWNENLADALEPQERMTIADDLNEYFETDQQVREQHFQRLRDGLELLGLTDIPVSDVPFSGASTVTHPLIAEACTQFQARAIEEVFPASGPVKAFIIGEKTQEKLEQSERLETYMNYQLTEEDLTYFWDTDQMLFYLPLSGSAFKKIQPDQITGMSVSRFVTAEDLIVPYHAKSLASASRYCHRYEMWENDIRRSQTAGTFIEDARLQPAPQISEDSTSFSSQRDEMDDKVDDRAPITHSDDEVYQLQEWHIDLHMPWDDEDDIAPPYIITIEPESREVLAVRRNWKADDETMKKRIWFVHYKYLPGLGFYGFGLLHIIGSLAKATSGGIRALLDSGARSNMQGGFKAKEAKIAGEIQLVPGEYQDVDLTADELQKAFFNPPWKEPSPALAEMVKTLAEEGRRFATTTENMVGEASNTGPVGTTLALIEQGSKVFSAIHKRLHKSGREEFKLLAALNYEFMEEDEYPYQLQGDDQKVLKQDFDGRVDIIPVSDPNIWSATQRIAQAQAVMGLIEADPEVYTIKTRKIAHRRMLEALRVPEVDELMPDQKDKPLDPVTENMGFLVGNGATAYQTQDHESHLKVHENFAAKSAAENPQLFQNVEPIIQAHMLEHQAWRYRAEVEKELGMPLPPVDLQDMENTEELPPELEQAISAAVANKMTPPPDPQQQTSEEEAESKSREDAADAEVIGKLKREMLAHGQKLEQEQESFDEESKRKAREFKAEQRREDKKSEAAIQRTDDEAAAKRKASFTAPAAKAKVRKKSSAKGKS